ncbi:hypothetical protein FHS00_000742 [Limimaricola variabilis]|uniref:Lipoprotein n=1 Tax=Limimaricola variabilis TaxID=1492771 RepID=A0ABR6HKW2_9RHOB|nr:hypothetical protein [Limimaricola variabilis]MBB3711180.1 hypothetical protein [Limimaricola variabilis]
MRLGVKTGAAALALFLAGCGEVEPLVMPLLESAALPPMAPPVAAVQVLPEPQPFEPEYAERPFEKGPMSVIAPDPQGDMATWRLIPCQGGQAICVNGHAGRLSMAEDTYVVSGVHGMSFHLETGGGGFVTRSGGGKFAPWKAPLAWEHFPEIELTALARPAVVVSTPSRPLVMK